MLRSVGWLGWTIVAYLLGASAFEFALALGRTPSPAVWIFVLLGLAFLAAATTLRWRRTAGVESVAVLVLLLLTAMFMGTH